MFQDAFFGLIRVRIRVGREPLGFVQNERLITEVLVHLDRDEANVGWK